MCNDLPHILVVGTGAVGGIGRFERLLMAALSDLAEQGTLRFTSIWRRSHPPYLRDRGGPGSRPIAQAAESSVAAFAIQLALAIRRDRPDLVFFLHVNLARVAPVGRALGARRYAIATYGVEVWAPLDRVRRRALHGASGVVSISEYTASQLAEHQGLSGNRVHVVPLALETSWLEAAASVAGRVSDASPAREEPGPRLLSVSRLEPFARDKGINHVIRSLPEVRLAVPGLRYHVVGDGPDRPYLERVAQECGVTDLVSFKGLLAHDDLIEEYRQANAFVLPSRREGFGLVFLEAMAYAKPVIALRAAAAVEVVADGRTGILVDDEQDLATAIIAVVSDENRAQAMGRAGAERLQDSFSFEAFRLRIASAVAAATA